MGRNGRARHVFGDTELATVNTQVSNYCVLSYTFLFNLFLAGLILCRESRTACQPKVLFLLLPISFFLLQFSLLPLSSACDKVGALPRKLAQCVTSHLYNTFSRPLGVGHSSPSGHVHQHLPADFLIPLRTNSATRDTNYDGLTHTDAVHLTQTDHFSTSTRKAAQCRNVTTVAPCANRGPPM